MHKKYRLNSIWSSWQSKLVLGCISVSVLLLAFFGYYAVNNAIADTNKTADVVNTENNQLNVFQQQSKEESSNVVDKKDVLDEKSATVKDETKNEESVDATQNANAVKAETFTAEVNMTDAYGGELEQPFAYIVGIKNFSDPLWWEFYQSKDIIQGSSFTTDLPTDFVGAVICGAAQHQISTGIVSDIDPSMSKIDIKLYSGRTTNILDSEGYGSTIVENGVFRFSILGQEVEIPIDFYTAIDMKMPWNNLGFDPDSKLDLRDDGSIVFNYASQYSPISFDVNLKVNAKEGYAFKEWNTVKYDSNEFVPGDTYKTIQPLFNDITKKEISGKLFAVDGSEPLATSNPYVWPVGISNGKLYIGTPDYAINLETGEFKLIVPADFMGFVATGADMHQTSLHMVAIEGDIGKVYLAAGNTTTVNSDSKGFETITLKAGSTFNINGFKIPIDNDITLTKNLPSLGFGTGKGESSTLDFQDDGKINYKYSMETSELSVGIDAILEATASQFYTFNSWDNEYYESDNNEVPATFVKVINPVFDFVVTGKLCPGTGSQGLADKHPYVMALGKVNSELYVGNINYNIGSDGSFSLVLPRDFIGVIIAGADMHQTTMHIAAGDMGNIFLSAGNTTTINSGSEGFETIKIKEGSSIKILDLDPIVISEDIEIGKILPAIGFAKGEGETASLDFKDNGIIDYCYENFGVSVNTILEAVAAEDYHFEKWDNEYYSTTNDVVPAYEVKVINPVFVKEGPVPPVPPTPPTPGPEPQPQPAPAPGSANASGVVQTGDNLGMDILFIAGIIAAASVGYVLIRKRNQH